MKKIICLAMLGMSACASKSSADNPVLAEAQRVHLEACEIQENVESRLAALDSLKRMLPKMGNPESTTLVHEADQLTLDFKNWEENLFEVPGFEHSHKGGEHHHHHDHTDAPQIPDEKMLEVQKEIKKEIQRISKDLKVISGKAEELIR